jgi:hypothetical protein
MKAVFLLCGFVLFLGSAMAQKTNVVALKKDSTKKVQVVETACGECQFKLKGNGCHLAVRINGTAYFVDGTDIDSHGDAHADDGFCNAVRKAEVQGTVVNNRYQVTWFQLVESKSTAPSKKKE